MNSGGKVARGVRRLHGPLPPRMPGGHAAGVAAGLVGFLLASWPAWAGADFRNRSYTGRLDGRYPIRMVLTRKGDRLTGRYVYTRVGKPLELRGAMEGGSVLRLDEFDAGGKRTGRFEASYTAPTVVEGIWISGDGRRRFPFRLEEERSRARDLFSGTWYRESGGSTFSLRLVRRGSRLEGTYDAVTPGGTRLDVDSPITGQVRGETALLRWRSGYSGATGRATFRPRGEVAEWQVTAIESGREMYAPRRATLRRR